MLGRASNPTKSPTRHIEVQRSVSIGGGCTIGPDTELASVSRLPTLMGASEPAVRPPTPHPLPSRSLFYATCPATQKRWAHVYQEGVVRLCNLLKNSASSGSEGAFDRRASLLGRASRTPGGIARRA